MVTAWKKYDCKLGTIPLKKNSGEELFSRGFQDTLVRQLKLRHFHFNFMLTTPFSECIACQNDRDLTGQQSQATCITFTVPDRTNKALLGAQLPYKREKSLEVLRREAIYGSPKRTPHAVAEKAESGPRRSPELSSEPSTSRRKRTGRRTEITEPKG